jgi:hypothetical protein
MGPIPSDDGKELYFSDLYIPSYTPSLSALIESRKRGSFSEHVDKLEALDSSCGTTRYPAWGVRRNQRHQTTKTRVTTLISAKATPETVIEGLRAHQFAHFVCHGLLETGKPFDASLELHKWLSNVAGDRPISTSRRRICVPCCLSHCRADRRQCCRRRPASLGCDAILWIPQRRRNYVGHGGYGWGRPI